MSAYTTTFSLLAALSVASACTPASEQNVIQSVDHSAQAASHGSAAAASGAASVAAVPILVTGGALAVSGAALAEVGAGSLAAGSELVSSANRPAAPVQTVRPNGPPTLN